MWRRSQEGFRCSQQSGNEDLADIDDVHSHELYIRVVDEQIFELDLSKDRARLYVSTPRQSGILLARGTKHGDILNGHTW